MFASPGPFGGEKLAELRTTRTRTYSYFSDSPIVEKEGG